MTIKATFFGPKSSGKTKLIRFLSFSEPLNHKYLPTIGYDFYTLTNQTGHNIQIWEGSLARRINFIQREAGKDIIDLEELNDIIAQKSNQSVHNSQPA
ncbi:P-loop NTPase family protein [Legionella hackeliae]|uniref:Uncharacterized protein n=1 Tax=Legionella hackeliae TaxID=449 RepID=A0A0A8UPZ7_LEGHA|nr:hypothetical protein [Legionella hackeliae]KTD09832.1 hypothetical protein Lhac_2200 [Legionella hackeliae]CEK10838.1 protein of unknown function [Legionella hackeliae]STX47576.1 Uncharacterised protein [Legionella hackeliae]